MKLPLDEVMDVDSDGADEDEDEDVDEELRKELDEDHHDDLGSGNCAKKARGGKPSKKQPGEILTCSPLL